MKIGSYQDVKNLEIERLESFLRDFQEEWDETKARRSTKWRKYFVICSVCVLSLSILTPQFLWLGLIVIAYFAGSLYSLLRQNAKTSNQIVEHKKQLRLVRLLRNFESSPFSQK